METRFYFVFVCALFCFSFSQGKVDGAAAIVGNNIILHSDVIQQAQFVAMEQKIDPIKSPYLFEKIYKSTLENIINQYAILGVAKKDTNLIISNDEIDRALNQQIESFIARAGSEALFLEMVGKSMRQVRSDYWKDIRDMMMIERFQFSKIQNIDVSRKEVESFYSSYKDSIPTVPEQYDFSVIEIPFVAGEASEERTFLFLKSIKNNVLNNGLSFDSLAHKYSQDPGTSPSGGYLGFTTRGSLVREFEQAAYSLSLNEISDPIRSSFGYHLIRLVDRQGEKISTQHILRTVDFSAEDRAAVFSLARGLIADINSRPLVFDSLANIYYSKYNNLSGIYSGLSLKEIPDIILPELFSLSENELSLPLETEGGYMLIFSYHHQNEVIPNLENSYNLIYHYAKQNKQSVFINTWVNGIKNKTYIKILYN